jgi:putative nucleotidyltransferase with HDIG domain
VRAGDAFFIVKPKGVTVDRDLLSKYRGQETFLFIEAADKERYFSRLGGTLSDVVRSQALTVREKAAVITDYAVDVVDRLFRDPGSPQNLQAARTIAQECVRYMSLHKHAFLHLVELTSHDSYTYAHSVGVAAYTMALARDTGVSHVGQLADLGLAGFLHDIGKCMVDPSIINKAGPLNESEWAMMRRHPEYGVEILRRHRGLNPIILLAAESHHENLVGSGYPKGLVSSRLDPLVRIVSIADAFSALTTKRSYSESKDSLTAFNLMSANVNKVFDGALFRRFVSLFLEPKNSSNLLTPT